MTMRHFFTVLLPLSPIPFLPTVGLQELPRRDESNPKGRYSEAVHEGLAGGATIGSTSTVPYSSDPDWCSLSEALCAHRASPSTRNSSLTVSISARK